METKHKTTRKLYAAYGSNTNIKQMKQRCPNSILLGTGFIKDYELKFNYYANIEPIHGKKVDVALWAISKEDEESLDIYEGLSHNLYRKETVVVNRHRHPNHFKHFEDDNKFKEFEQVNAMVYIMDIVSQPNQAPSEQYYKTVAKGYEENGLSQELLLVAVLKTKGKIESESSR